MSRGAVYRFLSAAYLGFLDFPKNLREDYQQLFSGPGDLPAPPWESVYRSPERLVMQEPAQAVRTEYLKMNLAPENPNEPPDHIGIELEFMARLIEKGDETKIVQRRFLTEHLRAWVPEFCGDVLKSARSDFYRGLALLTREFIEQDRT